jgi:hypothetical protein
MKTGERDNENGSSSVGTPAWIYEHQQIFKADGLYQLYAFLFQPTGELIAVGAVVDEDRGVLRNKGLIANGNAYPSRSSLASPDDPTRSNSIARSIFQATATPRVASLSRDSEHGS